MIRTIKISTLLFLFYLILFSCSCSCSYTCRGVTDYDFKIKEYNGVKITSVTYMKRDTRFVYFKKIDLMNNQYCKKSLTEAEYLNNGWDAGQYEFQHEFTEEDEKDFVDGIYSAGLLNMKDEYVNSYPDFDYYDWYIIIDYEDDTTKQTRGMSLQPNDLFNKCSTFFYDICHEEVIGELPRGYIKPNSLSLECIVNDVEIYAYSERVSIPRQYVNYEWNNSSLINNDIYEINKTCFIGPAILKYAKYQLEIKDIYYKKFSKLILKSYDYNEDLTNEKLICEKGYVEKFVVDLEPNKIYLCSVYYDDGNYYELTFNTLCGEMFYGYSYDYSSDKKNICIAFEEDKFNLYLSEKGGKTEIITGTYELKEEGIYNDPSGESRKHMKLYCYVDGDINKCIFFGFGLSHINYIKEKSTYHIEELNNINPNLHFISRSVDNYIKK